MLDWESTYIGESDFSSTDVAQVDDKTYALRFIAPPSLTRHKELDPAYSEAASNADGKIEISLNDDSPNATYIVEVGGNIANGLHEIIRQYKKGGHWNRLSKTFQKAICADDMETEVNIVPKTAVITKNHEALFFYDLIQKQ